MKLKVTAIILIVLSSVLYSQQFYTEMPDYCFSVVKNTESNNAYTLDDEVVELGSLSPYYTLGESIYNSSQRIYYHAMYTWLIDNQDIPAGLDIVSVKVTIQLSTSAPPPVLNDVNLFSIGTSLTNIDPDSQSDLNYLWEETDKNQSTPIGYVSNVQNIMEQTFTGSGNAVIQALESAVNNNYFTLGLAWKYEGPTAGSCYQYVRPNILLEIEYANPPGVVIVNQKLSSGENTGQVGIWDFGTFTYDYYNSPETFNFSLDDYQVIKGATNLINNEKFKQWEVGSSKYYINHNQFMIDSTIGEITAQLAPVINASIKNSFDGSDNQLASQISFKDPWLPDLGSDPIGAQNRGFNAIWHDYFTGSSTLSLNTTSDHKGVFPDLETTGTAPIYEVKVPNTQNITINSNQHNMQFVEWEKTGVDVYNSGLFASNIEADVVFRSNNAELKAIYKGVHLTNNVNELESTNQCKILQVSTNQYFATYTSMDKVWIERSTDGVNWSLANGGQPLSVNKSKSSSLAYSGNDIFIIYQEEDTYGYKIVLKRYNLALGGIAETETLYTTSDSDFEFNADPTFAVSGISYMGLWKVEDLGQWFTTPGYYYKWGKKIYGSFPITWYSGGMQLLPNTTANSSFASVVGHSWSSGDVFHVVWQENNTAIKYESSTVGEITDPLTWDWYSEVSAGCGLTRNMRPEMVVMNADLNPRVVWVGEKDEILIDDPTKSGSEKNSYVTYKYLVLRGLTGTTTKVWNPSSFKFGSDVTEAAVQRSITDGYVISWSENYTKKFIINSDWTIRSFGLTGNGLEVTHAPTQSEVRAITVSPSALTGLPHEIITSATVGSIIPKENNNSNSTGCEGIISKEGMQIYYTMADINVDGMLVDFVKSDELSAETKLKLSNSLLESESVSINDNSEVQISVMYDVINSELISNNFADDEYVKFKLELVDANTEKVIGVYDNVTYNKNNYSGNAAVSYKINTEGIGSRQVKFRLSVDENIDADYSVSHLLAEGKVLPGLRSEKISFEGDLQVIDFALEQNYPNPFNPETVINYQLPADGIVDLKVYDILGREVMTLVNEFQQTGKYSVKLNASSFSSGVYIYTIRVNDYSATKKMMLLK